MIKTVLLTLTFLATVGFGCKDDKKDKHANVKAEVRSVGPALLNFKDSSNPVLKLLANSNASLESYKVPIDSIRLATGLSGSGYAGASPNFYTCPFTTDAECAVDLTNASAVDNLLQGSNLSEVVVDDSKTYEGVAIEFCHEHASNDAKGYFTIWLKGSTVINNVPYFTNRAEGLSTNGPSEEIEIKSSFGGCGVTTKLLQPVVLAPDATINIILYADPTGAVFGAGEVPSNNPSCSGGVGAYICSEFVSIFGTVDTTAPVVEHYSLVIPDRQDALVTLIFNSSNVVTGASARPIFNGMQEPPSVGDIKFDTVSKNADATFTMTTEDENRLTIKMFEAFKREDHEGTMTIQSNSTTPYAAKKI